MSDCDAVESGMMSGEVSSILMKAHVCDTSVSTVVVEAYVTSYTIGGGSVNNSACASLLGAVAIADWILRMLFVAPGSA